MPTKEGYYIRIVRILKEIMMLTWLIIANILITLVLFLVNYRGLLDAKYNTALALSKTLQQQDFVVFRQEFDKHQLHNLAILQESLQKTFADLRQQLHETLNTNSKMLDQKFSQLIEQNLQQLQAIGGQVDKKLQEGFEKTTATFTDVVKRLAMIDAAQKKITELSSNVVNLQDLLIDKRARGALGEIQLSALLDNVIPKTHYQLQATLSNGKRVDCLLTLPQPTGNIAIDAKFPLESYQTMRNHQRNESARKTAESQFRKDIRKHIQDIAEKYIIPNETSDGAVMFIPAEAIFAEIHTQYPDIVALAHKSQVWIVSPSTLMAVLTTARAVLKDEATRKQVHIIREHLQFLAKDFQRFEKRMDNLSKHIDQAQQDVSDVHTSAKKITSRFLKIEKVDLSEVKHKNKILSEIAEDD